MNKLPAWFDGELYKKGDEVTNRFSGVKYTLTADKPKIVEDLRKGLDWFRKNNNKAYMALLD